MYEELKKLAENATQGDWNHYKHGVIKGGPVVTFVNGSSQQQIAMTTGTEWMRPDEQCANAEFIAAANPSAVLALIAENERLTGFVVRRRAEADQYDAALVEIAYQRDQLKAENESLRKDKDRLDALESNFWDVRHNSHPIADTGDSSSSLEIVGHWMDKPFERVIGESYSEDLRAAIDQAMKAPAYPPARPEYEYDEIPDFGGGSGNKARRRAESLGIDYDAAMRKGADL